MENKKKTFKNEKGTTLVEIMLSVALLVIIAAPLLGAVTSSVWNNSAAKDKTEAMALAQRVMGEIKAWKTLMPGTNVSYTTSTSGKLEAYYDIVYVKEGNISQSENSTYTYDSTAANNYDFELVINQGASDSNVSVKFIDNEEKSSSDTLVNVTNEGLTLKLDKGSYQIGKRTFSTGDENEIISNSFIPKDAIKLKVTYTYTASSDKKLKIYTEIGDINFKVYSLNIQETNSGVGFINKGTKDFEVIYMDTKNAFDYSKPINGLFRINVSIKKNGNEIYTTSSYVKK